MQTTLIRSYCRSFYSCFLVHFANLFDRQTYILECYTKQGAEVNLIFNLFRNVMNYVSPFFVEPMIAKLGTSAPYCLFAGLTVFFFPFTMGILMWRGERIREKSGMPNWGKE